MVSPNQVGYRNPVVRLFYWPGTAWLVLVVAIACSVLAWFESKAHVEERSEDLFRAETEDVLQHIATRMRGYEELLRGGVALFDASGGAVERAVWHRYVSTLDLETNFPGVRGFGFAKVLRPGEVAAFERKVRKEAFPQFAVVPKGARERYSAIDYLEPLDERNLRAIGFDMLSEPVRRAAMDRACDSGMPVISGRVTLVQETGVDVQPGFVMYLPVYRPDAALATAEMRRAALLGYVYAPFRAGDLMRGIGAMPEALDFELFDGTGTDTLLFGSVDDPARQARFQRSVGLEVAGHTWMARFRSRPAFEAQMEGSQPFMVLMGGLIISVLLFFAFRSVSREAYRVQRRVDRMTRTLVETATRLQLAQDIAQLGIWERNLVDGTVIWNQRMFELYDLSPMEFDGTDACWRRAVHPEDVERVIEERKAALRSGRRFTTVYRTRRKDGSVVYMEAQGAAVNGEDGAPDRLIGLTRDITRRVMAEQARAAEHARLQAIIDCIPDVVVLKDAQLVYQAVNPAAAAFLALDSQAIIGRTDFDLLPRHEAEMVRRQDLEVLRNGRPLRLEHAITGAAGTRLMETLKAPLLGAGGAIEGVVLTARDISELKRAKEALHREHAELEAVFSSTYANIAVMDREFRFVRVNAAFCAAVGGTPETFLGRSALELFPRSETVQRFRQVAESGRPLSVNASLFSHPVRGDTYWDCTISPLKGADGQVDGVVLTSIDCTERENRRRQVESIWTQARAELEERVRERTRGWEEANEKLASANFELESFSYSVSHDLRSPLRAINGYTHALEEDYSALLDATGKQYIARVHAATLRMGQLIDGLLNLARVFRSPIAPQTIDLSAIAGEQAELLRAAAPERCVRFEIENGISAVADEALVRVLLQNLLGNAWKFTSRRPDAVVGFGCVGQEGRRVFYVRDNGVGFEMEYANKLFKPFERLHAHGEFDGTGIGLATVRRIVQRHGGEVWGEGVPDHGATIYFTLAPDAEELDAEADAA